MSNRPKFIRECGINLLFYLAIAALKSLDNSADGSKGVLLTISSCAKILSDMHQGDSISINGILSIYCFPLKVPNFEIACKGTCLTVTAFDDACFEVTVSPETLQRTNLGFLQQGSRVNLERAVLSSDRMGGHFVQGHVETIAEILSITPDEETRVFRLQPRDKKVLRYIVEKGCITLDGASLTVTKVVDGEDGYCEVMLIPYTIGKLAEKKAGEYMNVETDISGKYIEKFVHAYLGWGKVECNLHGR